MAAATRQPAVLRLKDAGVWVTEADFASAIVQLARLQGWFVFYVPDSRRSPAGWPDLTMLKRFGDTTRFICAEIKTQRGRLNAAQRRCLDLLKGCPGIEVYVWRPEDFDRVVKVLE